MLDPLNISSYSISLVIEVKWRIRNHDEVLCFISFQDELLLLQHPKMVSRAGLVTVIGYCFEGCLGVVYDFEPLDALHNLLLDNGTHFCFSIIYSLRPAHCFTIQAVFQNLQV